MTTPCPPTRLLVIGIGNAYRSDDAVGLVMARHLRPLLPDHVTVVEAPRDGIALLDLWRQADAVILIDAVCSGAIPGTLHRLEVGKTPLAEGVCLTSTHGFGVAEAIELARELRQLPAFLAIYGIEGQTFSMGEGLSPAVARQVQTGVQTIVHEIQGKAPGWEAGDA
jgi:hydrogenase maturation protease